MLEVITAALEHVRCVVVLFTPDDDVSLRTDLARDEAEARAQTGRQARPNVLIEAGMAFALFPDRTIIVEVGDLRPITDLQGLHTIRYDATAQSRGALMARLRSCGCESSSNDFLGDRFATLP